jgi:transposase
VGLWQYLRHDLKPHPDQIAKMDADQLRAMLLGQIQINTQLQQTVQSSNAVIQAKDELIKEQAITIKYQETVLSKVTLELALHKRFRFSKKAESLTVEQRYLFDETLDGDIAQIEQEELDKLPEQDKEIVTRSLKPKRKPLPPELPRTEIRHEPDSTLCKCGCQLKRIGEDVAEKLDYQPGTFSVERHIRGKWVCDTCETLIQAPVPAHVIDKGMATTNLLAQVLVNKFADHLPLYRQEQIFDRTGYKLSASTMGSWVGQCGAALQPLVDALRTQILKQGVLHADETPITMLCAKQALKTGSASKKAYLWAYATTQHADIKAVVFDFAEGRSGQHAHAAIQQHQRTTAAQLEISVGINRELMFGLWIAQLGLHCIPSVRPLQSSLRHGVDIQNDVSQIAGVQATTCLDHCAVTNNQIIEYAKHTSTVCLGKQAGMIRS